MRALLVREHAALGEWQMAVLGVAVMEAAGRGLCFLRDSAVVTSTLASPRLSRQLTLEQRRALGAFFGVGPRPRLAQARVSEREIAQMCDRARCAGGERGECGGGGGRGGGAGWDVVKGGCASRQLRVS
jgi:hypothetical protein